MPLGATSTRPNVARCPASRACLFGGEGGHRVAEHRVVPVLHPGGAGVVRRPGEVEAVAAVRPDPARHPDRRVAVHQVAALLDVQLDEAADPVQPGGPAQGGARGRRPPSRPPRRTPSRSRSRSAASGVIAPLARREPRQAIPKRDPSSSANARHPRPGGSGAPPARGAVDRGQRGDHAQRPVVRPAVEDGVEVRAGQDPGRSRRPSRGRPTVATWLPLPSASTLEPAGTALLDEPGAQLGLDRGERLPEVAAARRGPAERRQVAPTSARSRQRSSVMLASMEFQDVVRRRRMVRNYTDEPVDPAIVDRALRNATRAPSAGFSQGWGFLVLDAPTGRAPLLDRHRRLGRPRPGRRGCAA